MRVNLTNLFISLGLFAALSSCQNQDRSVIKPSGQRFRLKKEISTSLRFYLSIVYNYDSQGKLVSYSKRSGSSSLVENSGSAAVANLTYDGQNRLVQLLIPRTQTSNSRFDYTYDKSGNMTTVNAYNDTSNPGTYVLTNTYTFEYGTGKSPVKIIYTTSGSSTQLVDKITYSNGNVSKVESIYNSDSITNYIATTAPNPYYGLITGQPTIENFSVNVINNTVTTYINTYDSNGFLIKQAEKTPFSSVDNIRTYEYETY